MIRVNRLGVFVRTEGPEPVQSEACFSFRTVFSNSFWRIAVLTAAGAVGIAAPAEATIYWPDSDPGFSRPAPEMLPPPPRRKQRVRRHPDGPSKKGIEVPVKEAAKPHGPLVIAISINKQNMKIYDANGFFAETPISTGMRGHPTPMGVFSVVAKEKLHHSNIYSGAPMPFMQRITWSGIAIHAGVLPGYPASHGCIRMPMAFAVKMYGWTRMGARVVIIPDEAVPTSFSHPLLVTTKIAPQPIAADEPKADKTRAAKADKTPDAVATTKPATSVASLELRSTVGHGDSAKSLVDASPASTPSREQTRTADASALSATESPVTMSDAALTGDRAPAREKPVATEPGNQERDASDRETVGPEAATVESMKPDAATTEAKTDDVKTEPAMIDTPKSTAKSDDKVKAATDVTTGVPGEKKDQARLPDTGNTIAPKADPAAAPKRTGQIAVFVSRKDSKLYVRQNFAPLFDVPVTIAPSDRPLGTHVFTVQIDKDDANVLHWSVVTLPVLDRNAERRDDDERASRRRKIAGAADVKALAPAPDSPAEALDRLTIPADAKARIVEALSTGSSIIVSDQGIAAGETGEGTDFIVSLR
jgi:lipoprotein-anchoring transpeptidase ErfK/SrfK